MEANQNRELHTLLISIDGHVSKGLSSYCGDDPDGLADWKKEWEEMNLDRDYINNKKQETQEKEVEEEYKDEHEKIEKSAKTADIVENQEHANESNDGDEAENESRELDENVDDEIDGDAIVNIAIADMSQKELDEACQVAQKYTMQEDENYWENSIDAYFPYDDLEVTEQVFYYNYCKYLVIMFAKINVETARQ